MQVNFVYKKTYASTSWWTYDSVTKQYQPIDMERAWNILDNLQRISNVTKYAMGVCKKVVSIYYPNKMIKMTV